jgi:uncharacterized protein
MSFDRTNPHSISGGASMQARIGKVALAISLAAILSLAEQAVAQPRAAASLAPNAPKQAFDAGMAALGRKDFATAARQFTIACNGLNGEGCFSLGSAYETGEGVSTDKARAVRLYDQACNLRAVDACINLGAMYIDGDGVGQSFDRAKAAYRRALVIDPQNDLALDGLKLVERRRLQPRANASARPATAPQALDAGIAAYRQNDFVTALRQFSTACDGRLAIGCYNLGAMYSNGYGVAPDKARAARLYDTACDEGVANGCNHLGSFYEQGTGVAQSNVRAIEYFRRALVIDPKHEDAQANLARVEKRRAAKR